MSAGGAFAVVRSWMADKLMAPKAVIDALERFIADKSVSFREMADLPAHTIIGRDNVLAGTPQALTLSGGLDFTGTGGIEIAAHGVTNDKFRQSAGLSLVGNATNATADVADIVAALDGQVMRRSGTAIAFGAVDLASANAITGNLPVANLNSGTGATSSTFWCGDATWKAITATGTVTHTAGSLTSGQLIVGNGSGDIKVGDLSGDVSTSGSGVTTIGALKVATGMIQASAVTLAKIANASASSKLLGSGASGSGAAYSELTLGTGLSMSGSTLNVSSAGSALPLSPGGRLTPTSGQPIPLADVTGVTTIYYTPYKSTLVPIWNGSNTVMTTFAELSQATTDTTKSPAACIANACYDLFVWNDSGTVRCTRGPVWAQSQTFTVTIASPAVFSCTGNGFYEGQPVIFTTTGALPTGLTAGTTYYVIGAGLTANAFEVSATPFGSAINTSGSQSGTQTATQHLTVRGTGAGTTQISLNADGYSTNTVDITNGPTAGRGTYVGTIRMTSASAVLNWICKPTTLTSGGAANELSVWNYYNRVLFIAENNDGATNWTYSTLAWRPRHGNVNAAIDFVIGVAEDMVELECNASPSNSSGNEGCGVAAVFDTFSGVANTVVGATVGGVVFGSSGAGQSIPLRSVGSGRFLGGHFAIQLEIAIATGTSTWPGSNGGNEKWCPSFLRFWG